MCEYLIAYLSLVYLYVFYLFIYLLVYIFIYFEELVMKGGNVFVLELLQHVHYRRTTSFISNILSSIKLTDKLSEPWQSSPDTFVVQVHFCFKCWNEWFSLSVESPILWLYLRVYFILFPCVYRIKWNIHKGTQLINGYIFIITFLPHEMINHRYVKE